MLSVSNIVCFTRKISSPPSSSTPLSFSQVESSSDTQIHSQRGHVLGFTGTTITVRGGLKSPSMQYRLQKAHLFPERWPRGFLLADTWSRSLDQKLLAVSNVTRNMIKFRREAVENVGKRDDDPEPVSHG